MSAEPQKFILTGGNSPEWLAGLAIEREVLISGCTEQMWPQPTATAIPTSQALSPAPNRHTASALLRLPGLQGTCRAASRAEGHLGGAIALSRGPAGVMLSLSKAEWLHLFCGSSSASFKIPLPSFHSCESSLSRVACSLGEVSTCAHTFSPGSTLPSLVPHSITKF